MPSPIAISISISVVSLVIAALSLWYARRENDPQELNTYASERFLFSPLRGEGPVDLAAFSTPFVFANPGPQSVVVILRVASLAIRFASKFDSDAANDRTISDEEMEEVRDDFGALLWQSVEFGSIEGLSIGALVDFIEEFRTGMPPENPRTSDRNLKDKAILSNVAVIGPRDVLMWTPVFALFSEDFGRMDNVAWANPTILRAVLTLDFDEANARGVKNHRARWEIDKGVLAAVLGTERGFRSGSIGMTRLGQRKHHQS